jgi:hypothetical protein
LKIKKITEENMVLDAEKDKNIEQYEREKIEISQEMLAKKDEKRIHIDTAEDIYAEKKELKNVRMQKELQLLNSIKNNFEFLKKLPALNYDQNKKRKLRFQMAKFNSQKKSYEEEIRLNLKKDVNIVEMSEHHMEFLKTF